MNETCEVCGAELIGECKSKVDPSPITVGGWTIRKEYQCGFVFEDGPKEKDDVVVRQCGNAHRIAMELKRQIV